MGKQRACGSCVMVWAKFYWEEVLLSPTTSLNITGDQTPFFIAQLFYDNSCLFQQTKVLQRTGQVKNINSLCLIIKLLRFPYYSIVMWCVGPNILFFRITTAELVTVKKPALKIWIRSQNKLFKAWSSWNIMRGFIQQLCAFKYILKQYSNEDKRKAIKTAASNIKV